MTAKQSLLEKIKDGSFALMTDEQIAVKLRMPKRQVSGLNAVLMSLVREGELLCDSKHRFGTAEQFHAVKGTVSGNERGFGFFMPDDGSGDLFLPHRALNGALHGDTVLAVPIRNGRSDDEGEVLAIIARGYTEIVGTYFRDKKAGYLHPDERKYAEDVYIPRAASANCPNGAKAVAKITSYKGGPSGEIIEILGESGDFFTEEAALIRAHNLREKFPDDVIKEADKQQQRSIAPADYQGRLDLRDKLIITVDGEDTRDIDDAISIEKKDGRYLLGVHIADVTNYVTRGSALDREAYARGTSVYFPDRVLPMLPKQLSNDICSLNEGVDRLTLSCLMTVDRRGNVLQKRVTPSVIRSRHRMTYTAVTAIADGDPAARELYPDLVEFVSAATELTRILQEARRARGSVALDVKEAKILYEDGKITIPDYKRTVSHEMIEQFMVLANESVASLMTAQKLPFVYRIHERPSEDKARDFMTFLAEAGINAKFDPLSVTPADYQKLLEALEGSPVYSLVNRVMLRSMMKAKYSPENLGHFGLASDCYCHFTSPIRRYPDLCIHRIIKEALTAPEQTKERYKQFVADAAAQSSECEKNATEAERDVDALYTVAYMQDKIGEEYEGIVSGVTAFGIFVELKNTVEGLIPLESLPDDSYTYVEERFLLRGTKNSFRLGEALRVKVVHVDWAARRTHFIFLNKIV